MTYKILASQKRVDYISSTQGDKLLARAANDSTLSGFDKSDITTILSLLSTSDPTRGKYLQWIVNQYLAEQFLLEDVTRVRDDMAQFLSIIKQLDKTDLNQYSYHEMADVSDLHFNQVVMEDNDITGSDIKVLYDGPHGWLVTPLTMEAAQRLGKGTKWCTSAENNNMFNQYDSDGSLHIWRDKSGNKIQIFVPDPGALRTHIQIMDAKDRPLNKHQLNDLRAHPVLQNIFQTYENSVTSPTSAYYYARDVICGRCPEAEDVIKTDALISYNYTKDIICGRWPEAEDVIKTDARMSYHYARDVIRGRWPEAEGMIKTDALVSYNYARDVICGRWPEAEELIKTDARTSYQYTRDVIKERWPEAEEVIKTDAHTSYHYARDVIRGRWPEAEGMIKTDAHTSYNYARDVICGRWPEAEEVIKTDACMSYHYTKDVIGERWPEAEDTINSNPEVANMYAKYVIDAHQAA